ncbi:hypothetical protein AeNC1_014917 [Aphanomyces euteiches]|nr:hypothetical protein AeNC1_014917 [Aphanomyces euteiches]
MQALKLLDAEHTTVYVGPISTITFYSTTSASSHADTTAYLQEQVDAIVAANPWLAGRIKSGWFMSNLTLEFGPNPSKIVVEEAQLPHLSRQLDYTEIVNMCSPFDVVHGTTLVNSEYPMLRMTWITISESQAALYFSLSHVVADGYTYYRLYGMLSGNTRIEALTASRILDFTSMAEKIVNGGNDSTQLLTSLPFIVNMVGTMAFTSSTSYSIHTFNSKWIADEKKKHKDASPVGFVSTNDILTSWAFRISQCDVGFMAINFRGRVEGVDRAHAGNYESALGYQPDDYATPALIRESIATNGFRRARSRNFPSMLSNSSTLVSSWVTLASAFRLFDSPIHIHDGIFPTDSNLDRSFVSSRKDLVVDDDPPLAP